MIELIEEAIKGGKRPMYAATPCTPLETLAETIRLRNRFRVRDPSSLRMKVLEKDVLVQCQRLGVDYVG